MGNRGFAGWYFKHQRAGDVLAFIPGRAESGPFVQMISAGGARCFPVSRFAVCGGVIQAGDCLFSPQGCHIALPGVHGDVDYGALLPLRSDIMGPFRFLPMECRHSVVSMAHTLTGSIWVDGVLHGFHGGVGYIEGDSGTSFPASYQWLQCNTFEEPCALMVSVARIPMGPMAFTGCICAICCRGREYRLATYRGVKILAAREGCIRLRQGALLLEIDVTPACAGHMLAAPVRGSMTGRIRERMDAAVALRLWEGERPVLCLTGTHAAYEFVPPRRTAGRTAKTTADRCRDERRLRPSPGGDGLSRLIQFRSAFF